MVEWCKKHNYTDFKLVFPPCEHWFVRYALFCQKQDDIADKNIVFRNNSSPYGCAFVIRKDVHQNQADCPYYKMSCDIDLEWELCVKRKRCT